MIARVRSLAAYDSPRADCSIEFNDGIDVDNIIAARVRAWYLALLDEAPENHLAPENFAERADIVSDGGYTFITPPALCRRIFSIKLAGWKRPVDVLPAEMAADTVRRQLNPYLAASPDEPVAVCCPGAEAGTAPRLMVWPASDTVELLTAVSDPGPEKYILDESALAGLESIAKNLI